MRLQGGQTLGGLQHLFQANMAEHRDGGDEADGTLELY